MNSKKVALISGEIGVEMEEEWGGMDSASLL